MQSTTFFLIGFSLTVKGQHPAPPELDDVFFARLSKIPEVFRWVTRWV